MRILWRARILAGDCCDALCAVAEFMDAAFAVKTIKCRAHIAASQMFDGLFEVRVALSQNLAQLHGRHASLLKLRERPVRLDGFVLPSVAYQENAIIPVQALDKLVNLPRGCKRRLVEHVQSLLAGVGLFAAGKVPLQRGGLDSRLGQSLRGARRGRKTVFASSARSSGYSGCS